MSNRIAAPRPLLQSRRATIKLNILAQINDKYPTHSFFSVVSPSQGWIIMHTRFPGSRHQRPQDPLCLSPAAALPPQTGGFGEALLGFSKATGSTGTAGSCRAGEQHTLITLPQNLPDTDSFCTIPRKRNGAKWYELTSMSPPSKWLPYKLQLAETHTQWQNKM